MFLRKRVLSVCFQFRGHYLCVSKAEGTMCVSEAEGTMRVSDSEGTICVFLRQRALSVSF